MSDFVIPLDQTVTIPLDFSDVAGAVKPPAGGVVASSNTAVATVTLAADSSSVTITPVSDGVGVSITYTNPNLPALPVATLLVDVVDPSPTSDAFDTTKAVFAPKV